jgi:hypothetical protein
LLEEATPNVPYVPSPFAALLPLAHVHSLAVELPTTIVAVPDFVASHVDVAVMVAVPAPIGVNVPEAVIVPSVAVQLTAELYDPVP